MTGVSLAIVAGVFTLGLLSLALANNADSHYQNLPMFPPGLFAKFEESPNKQFKKLIPQNLWIAVVNSSEVASWPHIMKIKENNPGWTVHIWDNKDKDSFMRKHFFGSRILWAYENINPAVGGAAKADVWRYAVLLLLGGVYIDSDSDFRKPLDDAIRENDELILGFENNDYVGDWCYQSYYRLSTIMQKKMHPLISTTDMFHGRMILNWCIMAAPRHLFLKQVLENFVYLVELEYIGLSAVKMQKWDVYAKHIYCTTGPFLYTATCREGYIQQLEAVKGDASQGSSNHLPTSFQVTMQSGGVTRDRDVDNTKQVKFLTNHRLASRDFLVEGAIFKVVNVNKESSHYTRAKSASHFLNTYAAENVTIQAVQDFVKTKDMDGSLVMGRSLRNIYYLEKGIRRPVGGMDVFLAYNWSLANVMHFSDFVMSVLPEGPPVEVPK